MHTSPLRTTPGLNDVRGIGCAGSGEAAPPHEGGFAPKRTFTSCLTAPPHRLRRRSADGGGSARTRGVGAASNDRPYSDRLRVAQQATGPRGARSAPPNPYAPYYANL